MHRFPNLRQALLLGMAMVLASGMLLVTCTPKAHAAPPPTASSQGQGPAPTYQWPKDPPPITRQPDQVLPGQQQQWPWDKPGWDKPENSTAPSTPGYSQAPPSNDLTRMGGVWAVRVLVNGTTKVTFVLDSGAADVGISRRLFNKLWQEGSVTKADMRGKQEYRTADGRVVYGQMFILKSIQIGDKIAYNVQASVSNDMPDDGMLLGQTFLQKFDSWSIDNRNSRLVLN